MLRRTGGKRFQFHKGTIKTNLCMVTFTLLSYFNSIKVRLKLKHITASTQFMTIFQFHKGTIKTLAFLDEGIKTWNFNSIKVRLKPKKALESSFTYL